MAPAAEKLWYLRQVDVFHGLSDEEVEEMGPMMEPRTFRPGELLVGPGTPPQRIYCVKRGRVRLFHRGPAGRELTAGVVGRGSLLGVSALFGPAQEGFLFAAAVTEVLVCVGDGWAFLQAIARWPRVMLNLAVQLGGQLVATELQLNRVASGDARTRLAAALYGLVREAGDEVVGGGWRLRAALTHAALAQQIGTTRETVTRLLAGLETAGFVRRDGRRIVVVDPQRLATAFGLLEDA